MLRAGGRWLRDGRWVMVAAALHGAAITVALPPVGVWAVALVAGAFLVLAGMIGERVMRDSGGTRGHCSVFWWASLGTLPGWIYQQAWIGSVTPVGWVFHIACMAMLTGGVSWTFVLIRRGWVGSGWAGGGWGECPVWLAGMLAFAFWEMLRGKIVVGGYAWAFVGHPLIESRALSAAAAVVGASGVSVMACAVGAACAQGAYAAVRAREVRGVAVASVVVASVTALWAGLSFVGWDAGERAERSEDGGAVRMRVGLLQTNVPQSNKTYGTIRDDWEEWQRAERLIARAVGMDGPARGDAAGDAAGEGASEGAGTSDEGERRGPMPDVIIWPETMLPGPTLEPAALRLLAEERIFFNIEKSPLDGEEVPTKVWATVFADRLLDVSEVIGVPMLVGAEALEGLTLEKAEGGGIRQDYARRFNSVYMVDQGRIARVRYDKTHLTPFGERIPGLWRFGRAQEWFAAVAARGMRLDLSHGGMSGNGRTVFEVRLAKDRGVARVVTPICFESTSASLHRELVFNDDGTRRAGLIANVTNDGWFFGYDMQRDQHTQLARWRSVETATPTVRAANTGVCAIIDARGRILARGIEGDPRGYRVEGVLVGEVVLGEGTTIFARIGDVPAWVFAGVGLVLALMGVRAGRGTNAA
jgi:apolipoprotein N-acyltransferase